MGRLVFLLEEKSMAECLRGVLPQLKPEWREDEHWVLVAHRGKSDLEKSIGPKLRAWQEPGVRFVILRDNDGGDCVKLKNRLREIACHRSAEEVLIRIVCQELESWFLGNLDALRQSYPHIKESEAAVPARYRNPDALTNASQEIEKLTREPGKIIRARKVGSFLDADKNRSRSFQVLIEGVRRMLETDA